MRLQFLAVSLLNRKHTLRPDDRRPVTVRVEDADEYMTARSAIWSDEHAAPLVITVSRDRLAREYELEDLDDMLASEDRA